MKNVLQMVGYFTEYKRLHPGPLQLVLMGAGPLAIPAHPDIIQVGFLTTREKLDAFAAATVLCQPSLLESFSIVLMEAWLAGTPVLVHGDCEVTRYHVLRSNGGLYFTSADEFAGAIDWFLAKQVQGASMGKLGRAYVMREYDWATVLARFRAALEVWSHSP